MDQLDLLAVEDIFSSLVECELLVVDLLLDELLDVVGFLLVVFVHHLFESLLLLIFTVGVFSFTALAAASRHFLFTG